MLKGKDERIEIKFEGKILEIETELTCLFLFGEKWYYTCLVSFRTVLPNKNLYATYMILISY